MDKESFVQNIKKYCALRGVKPTVACRECGVGSSFINNIEARGQTPSVEKVQLLAQYLGITTSDLLGETSPSGESMSPDEVQVLADYRSLSTQGQEYIRQTMHMAKQTYKKSPDLSKLEDQG